MPRKAPGWTPLPTLGTFSSHLADMQALRLDGRRDGVFGFAFAGQELLGRAH